MNKQFRSLIDELSDYAPARDKDLFIESRGQQAIASVLNLIRLINENYDDETAADLQKRLINSIRTGDETKFRRGIRNIRESRK